MDGRKKYRARRAIAAVMAALMRWPRRSSTTSIMPKAGSNPHSICFSEAICGRTEKDDDTLEFRYCTKCEGGLEYCQDHLFIHTHVKKGEPPHMMKM